MATGTIKLNDPIIVQQQEDANYERKILIKDGNLMHLHYERLEPVNNGTNVNSIPAQYAPSTSVSGSCWFYQNSGIGLVNCYVLTNGTIRVSAKSYDEPVAGVFDIYWTN